MDKAQEILVIITSSFLVIFLILSIIGLIYFIRVMRSIKRISARAEQIADSVESAAQAFEKSTTPLAILKMIGSVVDKVNNYERGKRYGKRR